MNEYERKFQAAQNELIQAGIWRRDTPPLTLRVMRKLGLKSRPSYYHPYWQLFIQLGLFMTFWIAVYHVISQLLWSKSDTPWIKLAGEGLLGGAIAGLLFGALVPLVLVGIAKKNNLSSWQSL